MKSRGVYETPGGTILLAAHRGIESITLDRGAMHLKDELMPKYASLVYNGFWFAPEREMLQAAIDYSQAKVTGQVRVKLYKGNVIDHRPHQPLQPLRPGPGHLRGRQGRLRPPRRRRLHQAQRPAPARAGQARQARRLISAKPAWRSIPSARPSDLLAGNDRHRDARRGVVVDVVVSVRHQVGCA